MTIRLPGFILMLALLTLQCWAQRPPSLSLLLSRNGLPLAMELQANTTGAFLVEQSADLKTWKPFMAVFTKVSTTHIADRLAWAPEGFRGVTYTNEARFYRVIHPWKSAQELLDEWRLNGPNDYRYTFRRDCWCSLQIQGEVIVEDGEIIGIVNAQSNELSLIEEPDWDLFETVEGLYEFAATASQQADVVRVRFDDTGLFPLWLDVDYYVDMADDEVWFWAGNLVRSLQIDQMKERRRRE